MAKDPEEKAEGQQVLKARIKRIEAREYDLAIERKNEEESKQAMKQARRASLQVAMTMPSKASIKKSVEGEAIGMSNSRLSQEMRARRDSTGKRESLKADLGYLNLGI